MDIIVWIVLSVIMVIAIYLLVRTLREEPINTIKEIRQKINEIEGRLESIGDLPRNVSDLKSELKNIFSDKQTRGLSAQKTLELIIGDKLPSNCVSFQETLSNGKRVDCLITLPKLPSISIDSKFPLESFQKLGEDTNDEIKKNYKKIFKSDVLKHVRDISSKYIITNETTDFAIMYIPSEAVYHEILDNHHEVLEESYKKNIIICSPSIFWGVLTTINTLYRDSQIQEQVKSIKKIVIEILDDVKRLHERSTRLHRRFEEMNEDFDLIDKSAKKIKKKADAVESLETKDEL